MVRRFTSRQLIKQIAVPNKNILPLPTTSINEREEENNLVILKKKRRRQQDPLLNRTFADRCAHLTTINNSTETVGIAKLTLPPKAIVNPRVTKLSKLPLDAVEALGGILLDSRVPPKQLQREADVLSNQLDQRHFPPSIVEFRQTRREILDEIFEENPAFCYDYNIYQNRPFIETQLAKLVQKRLAVRRYNWKPLKFKDLRQATVYCLSRFGGHFAEMKRVLAEFDRNGFVPEKILDFGSGIGSSFWAAYERWGDTVQEYSLIDSDLSMRHFSIDLSRGPNYSNNGELISKNLFFRKELFPSPKHTYDLVILHRTLIEMPSQEARKELIEKLWKRTKKYLVIVESSMPDAFKALIKIRDFILTAGYDFDLEKTKELLYEYKAIDQDTIEMLSDKNLQTYEKYCRARELLPEDVKIPTLIDPGHVFAPCPHDKRCPKIPKKESCKFSVRWQEFRADHKTTSINKDGTNVGNFSYLILAKGERSKEKEEKHPRILKLERGHRCVNCHVCTAADGLQRFIVGKRTDKIYARIRRAMPSQLLPVEFDLIKPKQTLSICADDEKERMNGGKEQLKQVASAE
uniref:Methyltransferase-like protein 17, mitochondrial n=1 Tax=Meloidogyne incognita TaxID=6306 RepID=A0A914L5G6_MELIC